MDQANMDKDKLENYCKGKKTKRIQAKKKALIT